MSLKEATELILFSNDEKAKEGIASLQNMFTEVLKNKLNSTLDDKTIYTDHGIVIGIESAANCLSDAKRTITFLRGIHQAISDRLPRSKPVKILYAGCGPFATLFTPLTAQFSTQEVSATLVDINSASLRTVEKLLNNLSLDAYIDELIETDLTKGEIALKAEYDIIISETMQFALKSECQVPITRNLVRFLTLGGTFIPVQIDISACLVDSSNISNEQGCGVSLGNVYSLNFKNMPLKGHSRRLSLPKDPKRFLQFLTDIQVYKRHKIAQSESGLTVPYNYGELRQDASMIDVKYVESSFPDWKVDYIP